MDELAATVSVEWAYEEHSITLSPRDWTRVKAGAPLQIRGEGYHYEGEFFWDYWSFAGGLDGSLVVSYGDDGGQGFIGNLSAAGIEEHEP